ncbi:MAG: hypothetical protein DSZ31_01110 [Gammaproteobacteria bacterium]|nr:MAG: hypothetical protein DSZ31_01110 [Gammaproteobacteria bacterium]
MNGANLFLEFLSLFPLKVKGENCINSEGKVFCSRCKEVCPHLAIEFENNTPKVDTQRCTVCGLCFSECPVNVFEIEIDLTEFYKDKTPLKVGCFLSDWELDIKVPCLGMLNEELLTSLALHSGEVYLDTSKCSICPQGGIYKYIKEYIERANLLLHYHRAEGKVKESSQPPESGEEEEFLKELFGEEEKVRKPTLSKRINVPLWRQLFFEKVKLLRAENLCYQPVKEERLRFAKPIFDPNRCQSSKVCSFWCPTRALSSDERGTYFTQILCTDCGLCQKVCPNSALTLEKSFVPRNNVMAGKIPITRSEKKICKNCGREFIATQGQEYCLYCQKDRQMEKLIKDFLFGENNG